MNCNLPQTELWNGEGRDSEGYHFVSSVLTVPLLILCLHYNKTKNYFCNLHVGSEFSVCIVGLVWQLMRAYTLSILRQLAGGDSLINDAAIIEWANAKVTIPNTMYCVLKTQCIIPHLKNTLSSFLQKFCDILHLVMHYGNKLSDVGQPFNCIVLHFSVEGGREKEQL